MPQNIVSDPITDQEMLFARLILSGAMTDRHAAKAAGLHPGSAAHIKSRPRVRAYMLEHRAAVQQEAVQQEAAEGGNRLNLDREKVLARLWEIANLGPEMTRGSITGQVKALSMIIAMQNLIPDRHAVPEKNSSTALARPQTYEAAWLRKQRATTVEPEPSPAPPDPEPGHSDSTIANHFSPSESQPSASYVPGLRVPFRIKKNPFARGR
jgi:hypothetical protein